MTKKKSIDNIEKDMESAIGHLNETEGENLTDEEWAERAMQEISKITPISVIKKKIGES